MNRISGRSSPQPPLRFSESASVPGNKRSGVSVVAQPEQNQIVAVNCSPRLAASTSSCSSYSCAARTRLDFPPHPQNGFIRNGRRTKQRFARHPKIALRRSSGGTQRSSPKVKRNCSHGRSRRWPSPHKPGAAYFRRKARSEIGCAPQRFARPCQNKLRGVRREVFVRRTCASARIKSRNAKDRAFPDNADDILRPG